MLREALKRLVRAFRRDMADGMLLHWNREAKQSDSTIEAMLREAPPPWDWRDVPPESMEEFFKDRDGT